MEHFDPHLDDSCILFLNGKFDLFRLSKVIYFLKGKEDGVGAGRVRKSWMGSENKMARVAGIRIT